MGMVAILVKYHFYIYWILHMKFEFKQPSDFGEKWCLDMYEAALDIRSYASLTFGAYFNISLKYYDFRLNSYRKNELCITNQTWPCRKNGQGQTRFIICANLNGPNPQCYIPSPKAIGL